VDYKRLVELLTISHTSLLWDLALSANLRSWNSDVSLCVIKQLIMRDFRLPPRST
jgi:hypothetical protein